MCYGTLVARECASELGRQATEQDAIERITDEVRNRLSLRDESFAHEILSVMEPHQFQEALFDLYEQMPEADDPVSRRLRRLFEQVIDIQSTTQVETQ